MEADETGEDTSTPNNNNNNVTDQKSPWPLIRQSVIAAGVSINIIGHGCAMGFPAVLLPSLRLPDSNIRASSDEESWIASVVGFALIIGNVITTLIVDVIGRKKTHFLSIVPVVIGWITLILANSVTLLIIARIFQGIAMGMNGLLASIIIAEMSDPKYRGPFLSLISVSLSVGNLFSHTVGAFISWRLAATVCSIITLLCIPFIIYSPESPSWLVKKNRFEESEVIFFWLRGTGERQRKEFNEMSRAQAKLMHRRMISALNLPDSSRISLFFRKLRKLFRKPEFYKPVLIMIIMFTMFQFSGINVISSYALDIIGDVVGPEANNKVLMVSLDIERVICNAIAIILIKIMKRRTLLFISGLYCISMYGCKAAFLYARESGAVSNEIQWIPIIILCLYVSSLFTGLAALPFAVSGEIFPLEHRGLGGGIGILGLSINFFLAVKMFPVLRNSIGLPMTYCVYGSIVAMSLVLLSFSLPETKDRTLQDIENAFRGIDNSQPSTMNFEEQLARASSHIII